MFITVNEWELQPHSYFNVGRDMELHFSCIKIIVCPKSYPVSTHTISSALFNILNVHCKIWSFKDGLDLLLTKRYQRNFLYSFAYCEEMNSFLHYLMNERYSFPCTLFCRTSYGDGIFIPFYKLSPDSKSTNCQ